MRLGAIRSSTDKGVKAEIEIIRELTADEVAAIDAAQARLYQFFHRHAFAYVMRKRQAFDEYSSELRARVEAAGNADLDVIAESFELTTRFTEFLLAFRLFLDHLETHLKRDFGKESERWMAYDTRKREIFDASPAYRIASGLRNQTHVSFPGTLSIHAREGDDKPVVTVDLELDRATALSTFSWKAHTRPDIESAPERIPLTPIMAASSQALAVLMADQMIADLPHALLSYEVLAPFISEVVSPNPGQPIMLDFEPEGGEVTSLGPFRPIRLDWRRLLDRAELDDFIILGPRTAEIHIAPFQPPDHDSGTDDASDR